MPDRSSPTLDTAAGVDRDLFPPSFLRLLSAVGPLVRRTRASIAPGAHVARGPGGPFLFRGHREYRAGDDLRRVDWTVLARHDRVVVREFEAERDARAEVWIDGSASHGPFGGRGAFARAAALACAVGLAGGGRVRLGVLRDGKAEPLVEADDPAGVRDVLVALSREAPSSRALLDTALPALLARLPRRSQLFLLSDLLTRAEPGVLHKMAGKAVHGALLHLRVPAALSGPTGSVWAARDVETGVVKVVHWTPALAARVAARAQAHADRWARHAGEVGLSYLAFAPQTDAETLLRRLAVEVP